MTDPSGMFGLGGLSVGFSMMLNMNVTTLVQGAVVAVTLQTIGGVGAELRKIGLQMIADGNLDAGLPVYQTGNRIFGLATFTAGVAANSIDAFGAGVTVLGLARALIGFVRVLPDTIRALPNVVRVLRSGQVPQLLRALARDYWAHGGGVSWQEAKAIVARFGFGFDQASNSAGSRFYNRRMSVLIAPNDMQGGQVNRIMLAEEIQHGLDMATSEAGRFARRNPGLKGQELVDRFHIEHFERIVQNASDGVFDFLTPEDLDGIRDIIQVLRL